MNKLPLPKPKRLLKRSKEELRNWRKNLKLKDKLGPKSERQRSDLARELESLGERLGEA